MATLCVTIHYQLRDNWESYKEFDTLQEAYDWSRGLREDELGYFSVEWVDGQGKEWYYDNWCEFMQEEGLNGE